MVAESFLARWNDGIMCSYRTIISPTRSEQSLDVAADMVHTMTANIEMFIRDKTQKTSIQLEQAHNEFAKFWSAIRAEGDLPAALHEFSVKHNARVA